MTRPLAPPWLFLAIVLTGCGEEVPGQGTTTTTTTTPPELPPPMDPLPGVDSTKTDQFATSRTCNQCHLAGDSPVMHDAEGHDLSPAYLWRSSMMAFAAKDPYYLALFSEARGARPGAEALVDAVCTRCHGPAGSAEAQHGGGSAGFDAITTGTDPTAHLARDGVTCSLCHQIQPDNLGEVQSFAGGFEIGFDREMYGPHMGPNAQPMSFFVEYTPTYAEHVLSSELCATCHTVLVPVLDAQGSPTGAQFVEQAPYFEWLSSSFAPATPCASCHLPPNGADGLPLQMPIAKYPDNLSARSPFGQHTFEGGNAYMLRVLADNVAWTGSDVAPAELEIAAQRAEAHLRGAAALSIVSAGLSGTDLEVVIEVQNLTGHKLPTGYPSRRMWLHVLAVDDSGDVVLESGEPGEGGSILSGDERVDEPGVVLPHRDVVGPGQAQIWEAVAVGGTGEPTHRPLDQVAFGKDNRILPDGFSGSGPYAGEIQPVGVSGDASFEAGRDRVRYRIPNGASVKRVTVDLMYQTLSRESADAIAITPTPAAVRFSQMVAARPPGPVTLATTSWE
jgi:hypothetical protein